MELVLGLAAAVLAGLATVAGSGVETKYKLAAVLAVAGFAMLAAFPERRVACVALWVLLHPLGIEKVFFIEATEGPQFMNPSITVNSSDGPLLLLALFLIGETIATGRSAFRWSRPATILLLFLVWSAISYAIHLEYLDDGFITAGPMTLGQDLRLLVFFVLIQSAIRTRGDVILVLVATAIAILIQTGFVGLTYETGSLYTYASVAGGSIGLQTYGTSGDAELVRATGTVGQTNEQAAYHVFMTIPVLAFFALRSGVTRMAGLVIIAGSTVAVVLTFSRGAWLTLPLGLIACGAIAWRRGMMGRQAAMVGALGALGMGVLLIFLAQPIYQRLVYGDDGATDSRLRMIRLAADLFETNPVIGVGPGEFVEAALRLFPARLDENEWLLPGEKMLYPAATIGRVDIAQITLEGYHLRRPLPVHNKYMLTVSELGIPGLLIWLWLYGSLLVVAWRCSKSPDLFLKLVGISGVGVVIAELVYMQVDLFHEDKPLEFMLFIPALMVAASRVAKLPTFASLAVQ